MKQVIRSLLLLVLMATPKLASNEAENLKGLKQVKIVAAELPPEAREAGLSRDTLESQVRTSLRRSMPRLALHHVAHSYVYVRATFLKEDSVSPQEPRCTTLLELDVHRPGTILNDELRPEVTLAMVPVWEKSVLFSGPCDGAGKVVRTQLEELLRSLAADYTLANP